MSTAAEMREMRLVGDLRNALDRSDQLTIHYMPTVALTTGVFTGVEALVRWEHPQLGMIPPMDFVPLAERHGLASILGEYVRKLVVLDATAGRLPTDRVAVNVSGAELSDPQFADRLFDLLEQNGLDPARLAVEVTETAVAADADRATETLLRLRAAGIGVAIDDFGTGHATLAYLASLPCDVVKIDRSFTAGLGTDRRCTAIVHGVISMAHALGLTIIAEGVETSSQREQLTALNCEEGQGYLFGKAVPAASFRQHSATRAYGAPRSLPAIPSQRSTHTGGQVLLDLARDLEYCTELQGALECTLRAIRPHIVFTGGSIQLIGLDGIRLAAAHPPATPEALAARIPAGQGVGGAIIASRELRYIPDITALSAAVPSRRRRTSTTRDTHSYLGIPLLVAGQSIGLIQIDSVDVDAFDVQEQLLLTGCAAILATAIATMGSRSRGPARAAEAVESAG